MITNPQQIGSKRANRLEIGQKVNILQSYFTSINDS